MRVERFFHIRGKYIPGGATVRVVGDTEHPAQVEVQAAYCSPKDAYCKKAGRELAASRTPKIVPLRYLPKELARIGAQADKIAHIACFGNANYDFSVKYFLPKE